MEYINKKVYGLPKPKHLGKRNRYKFQYPPYIHKVSINGSKYFKVHMKRSGKSKIHYFKTMKEAKLFTDSLKENPYI